MKETEVSVMLAKGVFVEDYMKLSIREYDVPEPTATQVMIKPWPAVCAAGIPGCTEALMRRDRCPIS